MQTGNAAPPPKLRVGDVVGSYTVVREIGRGAMATVYEASRAEGKSVALKVLLPQVEQQAQLRERFEREGRILQALRHENIARVYEVGVLPNGSLFLAIELLEGSDLGSMLDAVGLLSVPMAVRHVLGAARGVAEAHAQGIVHRDLKPANLFLAKNRAGQDVVKVLDFGVAKVLGAVESAAEASEVIGSPHYIAPEQLEGSVAVTPRTDVWALGVVLYRAITDTFPFEGASLTDLIRRIREGNPRAVRELRPDCPLGLQDVIRRCLSKDPAARYAHAGELADALDAFTVIEDDEVTRIVIEDDEVTRITEESTRLMPDARGMQQRSAIASITGMRAAGDPGTASRSVMSIGAITASALSSSSMASSMQRLAPTGISAVSSGSFRAVATSPPSPSGAARPVPWWVAGVVAAVLVLAAGAAIVVRTTPVFSGHGSSVKVRVTSHPEGAFFTVDYGTQNVAPGELTLRRDDRAHLLTVWKDGYRPETRDVSTNNDVTVDVTLVPIH
jgi:serine/threonine-protein kinase